jgi:predicted ABC-type ATPase
VPDALVVGGPNGAGKSTFATEYLKDREQRYLSADHIAAEMNPDAPETAKIQAGKAFLRRLKRSIEERRSVVVESTLAGRGMGRMLDQFQDAGYAVEIVFIFVDTPRACIRRVRERVRRGGHDVPRSDIVRRFYRSASNFWGQYRYQVDRWYLFSNAGDQFREVAFGMGTRFTVTDEDHFDLFLQIISEANE